MRASCSDTSTPTVANKLISPKDSAWITAFVKRSVHSRWQHEDHRGLRGMSEGLPTLQVSGDTWAFAHVTPLRNPAVSPGNPCDMQLTSRCWLSVTGHLFYFRLGVRKSRTQSCGCVVGGGQPSWKQLTGYELWRWREDV